MAPLSNLPAQMPVVTAGRVVENGAGTYNFDVFVPAGNLILDLGIHNEVLWSAATSAVVIVGDYADASHVISTAIDDDGFIASASVKATDMLSGEAISLNGISLQGGKGGAYATVGTNTHVQERLSLVDRWVRFKFTSVGAGTAGRSYCWLTQVPLSVADVTQ